MGWNLPVCQYALDMLIEVVMLSCKPVDPPMDSDLKLMAEPGGLLYDP